MRLVLALVLLAGCPRTEPTCKQAFRALGDRLKAAEHSEYERGLDAQFVVLARERCVEDGWGMAARKCILAAGSFADFDACETQLTDAQRAALRRPNR